MPSFGSYKGRRSERVISKRRASLIINPERKPERLPSLVINSSNEGFRLRGAFYLKRGQVVEIVLDDDLSSFQRCSVVWVGRAGSKHDGEVGLEIV